MKIKKDIRNRILKISSLDIIGVFAIFFVTASIYLFLGRKTEYLEITLRLFNHSSPEYNFDSNQPISWYIEHIKPGKVQKSALGESLVEIVDVYSYPNGYVYNDVYVTLKIKTAQNKITKQYIYEGSPLLIHDVRTFRIQDLLVSGEIIEIGENQPEFKKMEVTFEIEPKKLGSKIENSSQAMILGVENYVADKINSGMTIKDSLGQELVKIIAVKKKTGGVNLATINGIKKIFDPDRTQVTIETHLLAEKINEHYYYRREEPIIIDERIHLTFDQLTIVGKIINIQEL